MNNLSLYCNQLQTKDEVRLFFQSQNMFFPTYPCFGREFSQLVYSGKKSVRIIFNVYFVSAFKIKPVNPYFSTRILQCSPMPEKKSNRALQIQFCSQSIST